jgi:hypothetical protein
MLLRKSGVFGALLGAAVFAGCDDDGTDAVQEKQEDVIEAQQNLREQEAERNQLQQQKQIEVNDEGGGPVANDTTIAAPAVPPVPDRGSSTTRDAADQGPSLEPLPSNIETGNVPTEELPNEGNPNAGTTEASDSNDAEPVKGESGSSGEETPAEAPQPESAP